MLEIFYRSNSPRWVRVQELHSTKGWRPSALVNANHFPWKPVVGAFHWRPNPKKRHYPSDAGRWMRNRTPIVGPKPDLMAHGWYRRKMRLEAQHAELS